LTPRVKNVVRLDDIHRNGNQRYYPNLVGYKRYNELVPSSRGNRPTELVRSTSATRAQKISQCDYARTYYDQTGEGVFAKEMIELDEFFLRTHPMDVDFIKIDADGSDY
jgi:hypothetical protein